MQKGLLHWHPDLVELKLLISVIRRLFWLLDIIKVKLKCLISKFLQKELLVVYKEKDLSLPNRKRQLLITNAVMLSYLGFWKELIHYSKLLSFQDLKELWDSLNILSIKINFKLNNNYLIESALFWAEDALNSISLNK